MSYTKKQMKSELWDIVYKAQAVRVSKKVTDAIIDIMTLMDKEELKQKSDDYLLRALIKSGELHQPLHENMKFHDLDDDEYNELLSVMG